MNAPAIIDELLRRIGRRRELRRNEVLFRLGDATRGAYYVESGRVSLRRHTASGRPVVIHSASSGTLFAEASLYAPHYHCDALADLESVVIELPRHAMLTIFAEEPVMTRGYCEHLAREVMRLRARMELCQIRNARERILAYLALDADSAGVVRLDRPWNALAAEIGLTGEAVYRALAALEKSGRIARDAAGIGIIRLR